MRTPREFVQSSVSTSADVLFAARRSVSDFEFDHDVVSVFPDMIERSVPDYWNMVDSIGRIGARRVPTDSVFYDLGCSLGAVAWSFYRHNGRDNPIVGIDSSPAMMARFRENMQLVERDNPIELRQEDIRQADLRGAGVVSLHLTLQFLAPEDRLSVLRRIWTHLEPDGVLFLTEKVRFEDDELNELIRAMHHDFKHAQGYSRVEIAQKAAAIANVMRVDTLATHLERLAAAGFSNAVVWHQHNNF